MTREEAIKTLKENLCGQCAYGSQCMQSCDIRSCDNRDAIKALEQEPRPMEKFKSVKDHIFKLAGDYKCWDNRLTDDEALELCHILEQEPCEDCCNGNQEEKAKLCQKSYLAGMEHRQEPSEDCIARQPLIDNWNSCADMLMNEGDAEIVMGWIFDAPPIIPQPKIGTWIEERNGWREITNWHCSNCYDDSGFITTCKWDYCPNCGAKMKSGE